MKDDRDVRLEHVHFILFESLNLYLLGELDHRLEIDIGLLFLLENNVNDQLGLEKVTRILIHSCDQMKYHTF